VMVGALGCSGVISTSSGDGTSGSTGSTGSGSGSSGEQPSCGDMCMGNYGCGTEAQATCGDLLNTPHCESDSACPGGYCHACDTGVSICASSCTGNGDCVGWESCTAGRCTPLACTSDASCPANFECTNAKTCARKSCGSDSDCAGYCVLGACEADPGYCVCMGC
jgi:hypothetical protein